MSNLFRREVIEHQRNKFAGKALLIYGAPAWLIALLSITFIIALVLFMTRCNYTRRVNIYGEIITQPRSINIFSPQQGFIANRFVNEGDLVKKGKPLYQIDVSRVTDSGKVSTNTRIALENQVSQIDSIVKKLKENKNITIDNIKKQKEKYNMAFSQSQGVVDNASKGVEFARKNVRAYEDYHRRGLITKDQLISQTFSYYQQQNIFHSLYNDHIQEALQLINLDSEIITRAADFDNQISQFQLQSSELQKELAEAEANESLIVGSPINGRIESLSVSVGQMVNAGDSLTQLTPEIDSSYYLVLWVPNSSVPYISLGDSVNIRYEAFPYEKFGQFHGKIEKIAYVPASTQEMITYSSSPAHQSLVLKEAYYKVILSLDNSHFTYQGKTLHLSNGMKAQSTLFLEKRPLYQWMLSPFYDIKKSLTDPIHE